MGVYNGPGVIETDVFSTKQKTHKSRTKKRLKLRKCFVNKIRKAKKEENACHDIVLN